jgi:hypothetical protein
MTSEDNLLSPQFPLFTGARDAATVISGELAVELLNYRSAPLPLRSGDRDPHIRIKFAAQA